MMLKILYSYFTLANLTALAGKIRLYLVAKFPDHPMLTPILANLQSNINIALKSVGSSTKQPLTKSLRGADKKRDNSYLSLRDHIHAGLRRENEDYRKACESLCPIFEKNGFELSRLPDGDQTSAVNSLLHDLDNDEDKTCLETIHATQWLQELDRDNKNFVTMSQQRSSKRSVDTTLPDDIALSKIKSSLGLVCGALAALHATNAPDGIQGAVNEINEYIREANASAKLGRSRPKPGETEDE
jgi:hypothetical protein